MTIYSEAVSALKRFPNQIVAFLDGLSPDAVAYKPPSGNWSILEIVCHLADEEEFDFPVRLRLTLEGGTSWPPIDPEGWPIEKDYASQNLDEALERFLAQRKQSLAWLRELSVEEVNWSATYQHPEYGEFKAGDLLFAWAAHDLLHLRQLTKRLFEFNQFCAGPFSTRYAGDW